MKTPTTPTTPAGMSTPDPVLRLPVTVNFACGASFAIRQHHKALAANGAVRFEYVPWQEQGYVPKPEDIAFVQREGAPFPRPKAGVDHTRVLGGIAFARANGRESEYVDAAFDATRAGEDVGDEEVLRSIASRAGLDATRFLAFVAKEGTAWARQAQENAARAGATRTATYLVPGKDGPVPLVGMFPRAQLEKQIAALRA